MVIVIYFGNIKKGINIFGVNGTMQEGENLDAAISEDNLISQTPLYKVRLLGRLRLSGCY